MIARGTRPKHARRLPFAVVVTALVLGGLALLLVLNTAAAANELRRHALAVRDQAIAAEVEQLRNEIAASAAPGNLASAAAALGMVPAGNPAFIVDAGRRLEVRGRPLPAPEPVIPLPTHPAAHKKTAQDKPKAAKRSRGAGKTTEPAPKTTTTTATATTTAASTSTAAKPARHTESSSPPASSTAAPSPTPTPTVTLPGGPR